MFSRLTLLIASNMAVATIRNAYPKVLSRQDTDGGCATQCAALEATLTGTDAGQASAICSQTVVGDYSSCYGCSVSAGTITQADAQQTLDEFIAGCKAAGFPVNDMTITGDGSAPVDPSGSAADTNDTTSSTADTDGDGSTAVADATSSGDIAPVGSTAIVSDASRPSAGAASGTLSAGAAAGHSAAAAAPTPIGSAAGAPVGNTAGVAPPSKSTVTPAKTTGSGVRLRSGLFSEIASAVAVILVSFVAV
ncbi:hypothetical protein B0H10DRAFT_2214166 [Mycena sp. CBHHK59/15]|nr:hypothetical protein B0H10DRAFT_2214166 [Mycena sp. CBHHK59/15]